MRVLVIPEDYRKDQYVLQPILAAMFDELGYPRARVAVCRAPLLGGVTEALKWDRIREILDRYRGMTDIFLLCVDRDGDPNRTASLTALETRARKELDVVQGFLGENAWQELEVWILAGHDLPSDWGWKELRTEVHPKEKYFQPFARDRGLEDEPGGGRRSLARQAAARYDRIRRLCREDVERLESRVRNHLDLIRILS